MFVTVIICTRFKPFYEDWLSHHFNGITVYISIFFVFGRIKIRIVDLKYKLRCPFDREFSKDWNCHIKK